MKTVIAKMLAEMLASLGVQASRRVFEVLIERIGPALLRGHSPTVRDLIRAAADAEAEVKFGAKP